MADVAGVVVGEVVGVAGNRRSSRTRVVADSTVAWDTEARSRVDRTVVPLVSYRRVAV